MELAPGVQYRATLTTRDASGASANADVLPVVAVKRNGAKDEVLAAMVLSDSGETGQYGVSFVIPGNYVSGDFVEPVARVVVGGKTDRVPLRPFVVRSKNIDDKTIGFQPDAEFLDANGAGGVWTWKDAMRLMFAFLVGERSGGGLAIKSFAVPGGAKTRVRMKTDGYGNSAEPHELDAEDA
jgi:hypothetical protein